MESPDKKKNLTPLQQKELELYKIFKKICDQHHLRYYAISGTTIGAVLWKGFIPWDDDMDISLPVKDYKKFVRLCKTELPDHIKIKEMLGFGCQIHDDRTTFVDFTQAGDINQYTGVFIDIVPLIGLPEKQSEIKSFMNDYREFYRYALAYKNYGKISKHPLRELEKWQEKFLTSYDFDTAKYAMDFSQCRCQVLETKGFKDPIIMPFEDTEIPVPSNYNENLKIQYGNIQKFPPESERDPHKKGHFFSLTDSIETSYKKYQQIPDFPKKIIDKHIDTIAYFQDENIAWWNHSLLQDQEIEGLRQEIEKLQQEINITNQEIKITNKKISNFKKSKGYKILAKLYTTLNKDLPF